MNLLCGYLSIFFLLKEQYMLSIYLILSAVFFDSIDGFAARKLKVSSPLGKDLDSLADLVSFGVAPSLVIYMMYFNDTSSSGIEMIVCALVPLFGAYRLARFNNKKNTDARYFEGIPITFNGLFLVLIALFGHFINRALLLVSMLLLSVLMVSKFKIPSLKKGNKNILSFLLLVTIVSVIKWFLT